MVKHRYHVYTYIIEDGKRTPKTDFIYYTSCPLQLGQKFVWCVGNLGGHELAEVEVKTIAEMVPHSFDWPGRKRFIHSNPNKPIPSLERVVLADITWVDKGAYPHCQKWYD